MAIIFAVCALFLVLLLSTQTSSRTQSASQKNPQELGYIPMPDCNVCGEHSEPDNSTSDNPVSIGNLSLFNDVEDRDEVPNNTSLYSPTVQTLAIRNIEANSANFRGEVSLNDHSGGVVFVVYGYNKNDVESLIRRDTTLDSLPELKTDEVRIKEVTSRPKQTQEYEQKISSLAQDTRYYYQYCFEYNSGTPSATITCGITESFITNKSNINSNRFSKPRLSVDSATDVQAYEVTLTGEVKMNDAKDGVLFFVYGEDKEDIRNVSSDYTRYTSVRERGDSLQKTRVSSNVRGTGEYITTVDDLDRGTEHYFSLCVEYDGEESGLTCSSAKSFTTDSRDRSDLPEAYISNSSLVTAVDARVTGTASMNDFSNGLVFFVFGTEEDKIIDIENNSSFSRIRQSIDESQRLIVDYDLDTRDSYTINMGDLEESTDYFYRFCIEYTDKDDANRDQQFIVCSLVDSIETR